MANEQKLTTVGQMRDFAQRQDARDDEQEAQIQQKLDKLDFEFKKAINFGSTGCLYLGKFGVYDTLVAVDITCSTNLTYSGKLVIATQNYVIKQASVYGDAADTIAPNIFIKPSTTSDRYIEVYFKPSGWSKNTLHIFGSALASYENICQNVASIPDTATVKPVNMLTENFATTAITTAEIDAIMAT